MKQFESGIVIKYETTLKLEFLMQIHIKINFTKKFSHSTLHIYSFTPPL